MILNIPTVMERWGYLFEEDAGMRKQVIRTAADLWTGLRRWGGEITPRRAVAIAVAVVLWMGTGGMTASGVISPVRSGFGEIHWYGIE